MLPIIDKKDEIISLLKNNQVLIISGETGSGKTTQLPQFCREIGLGDKGKIAITQPRRIAATSISKRIAEELKTNLGDIVGYKVRFSQKYTKNTQILCVTDGILLAELVNNPKLLGYSVIIIDEAHERSLNIDLMLGYLRKILPTRTDLKLIISSATMDTSLFSKAFDNAPVVEVSGRMFPVDIIYDDIESGDEGDYINRAVSSVQYITDIEDNGDILVFMPTERDILETVKKLKGRLHSNALILPLFSRLTNAEQNKIFTDTETRKVIVSTNIAETSITLPKIKFVVDTGLVRIAKYAPNLRTNRLPVEEISKAEAKQRSGRSGRVSDGTCIRLYSEKNFEGRDEFRLPEIQRLNLAGVILQMLNLNLGDVKNFPFIQPPETRRIDDAINQLNELGAISNKHTEDIRLTKIGRIMSKFVLEPHISRMIIEAQNLGVAKYVAIIAAGLSVVDPRERPTEKEDEADKAQQKFIDIHSDFITLLKIWCFFHDNFEGQKSQNAKRKYCKEHFLSFNRMTEWGDIYEQISQTCREHDKNYDKTKIDFEELTMGERSSIHRSICAGLLGNIATYDSEKQTYLATKNRSVYVFPGSVLAGGKKRKAQWIMAQQITETSRTFARTLGPIEPKWILDFAPNLCKKRYSSPYYDVGAGSVVAQERVLFYGLEISSGQKRFWGNINAKEAREIFIQSALIEEATTKNFEFLKRNSELVHKTRMISDNELLEFYNKNIPENISSDKQLFGLIKRKGSDSFLTMENKTGEEFPDFLQVANTKFRLTYKRNFGQVDDGTTVEIPENEIKFVDSRTHDKIKERNIRIKITGNIPNPKLKKYLDSKTIRDVENVCNTPIQNNDYGYPALTAQERSVDLMYYATPEAAAEANKFGLAKLLELSIIDDLMWLQKKLKKEKRLYDIVFDAVCFPITNVENEEDFARVRAERIEMLKRAERNILNTLAKYKEAVIKVKCKISAELRKIPKSKVLKSIEEDLLIYEQEFKEGYCPLEIFERYPYYVESLLYKIDKALHSPKHFDECEKTILKYRDIVADLLEKEDSAFTRRLSFLVEELSIKLFAEPKIKPAENISVKKLDKFLEESLLNLA